MFDPLKGRTNNSILFIRAENESALVFDPLADLLLSVAAIIILALIVILPTIPSYPTSADSAARAIDKLASANFYLDGRKVEPMIAREQGLATEASAQDLIPVGRIFLDDGLVNKLKQMRDAGEAIVLLIEPKGLETAFQFEIIANRYGPKQIIQVRLDANCTHAKSESLSHYCRNGGR